MKEKIEALYQEYLDILNLQEFDESELDYSILDKHIKMLEQINVLDTSCISVFDLYKKEHIFLSSRFQSILGYDIDQAQMQGNSYLDDKVHPDDFVKSLEVGIEYFKFAFQIKPEERKYYKSISDYRVKNGKNDYVRVVEQQQLLEADNRGNIWLALGVMDISPVQEIDAPFRSRLVNTKNGEIFEFLSQKDKPNLSKREQEILTLIAKGKASKQIADELYISVHTVNTHRQRIIEKLNVSNTFEAIKYADSLKLI